MVQEAVRQALLFDGKVLVIRDFNKKINLKHLNPYGLKETWRHKFLERIQDNFLE